MEKINTLKWDSVFQRKTDIWTFSVWVAGLTSGMLLALYSYSLGMITTLFSSIILKILIILIGLTIGLELISRLLGAFSSAFIKTTVNQELMQRVKSKGGLD